MNHSVYVNYKKAYLNSKMNEIVEKFMKDYPEYDNEELIRDIVCKIYKKSNSLNSLLDGTIETKIIIAYQEMMDNQEEVENFKTM